MRSRLVALFLLVPAMTASTLVTTVLPSTPAVAAVTIDGPDVSSYQHPGGASINWAAVARAGHEFAIVKATEGTSYVNKYFRADYTGVRKAGMVRGSYHYAKPAVPIATSALAQAQFYVAHIGDVNTTKTLPPALDLEESGGLSRAALVTWAQDFLLDVRALTGRTPMIYTYPWFWQYAVGDAAALARYPLWMAAYHGTTPDAAAMLWQYTAGATVSGIRGHVDMSRLLADPTAWDALSDGSVVVPWPDAVPGAPTHVRSRPGVGGATVAWLPGDAGSSAITGYTATIAPADGSAPAQVVSVAATRFTTSFAGLAPEVPYVVTVAARNAVGAGAVAAPAATVIPQHLTVLTATGPAAVGYGTASAFVATLRRGDTGTPVAGALLSFATRSHGTGLWTTRGTLTTDGNGTVIRTFAPGRNDDVRFSYAGDVGLAPASVLQSVDVFPVVTARLTAARAAVKQRVLFGGHVTPARRGVLVLREVFAAGRWHVAARTHTNRNGNYRFPVGAPAPARLVYRAVVPASSSRLAGLSRTLTLHVG